MVLSQLIVIACSVPAAAIILAVMDNGLVNDNPALYDSRPATREEELRAFQLGNLGAFMPYMHNPNVKV